MLSMRQLSKFNDSAIKVRKENMESGLSNLTSSFSFMTNQNLKLYDQKMVAKMKIDSIQHLIPDSAINSTLETSASRLSSLQSTLEYINTSYKEKSKDIRKFDIEWQRKIALSFACFVLFLIGAPLGSIIRKGGIGAPLVFGINFFVVFHLLNTLGEKLAKEGVITPFGGMWLASMLLLPVGIFLTYKAMNDSQLMNKEFYFRSYTRVKSWWVKRKQQRKDDKLARVAKDLVEKEDIIDINT